MKSYCIMHLERHVATIRKDGSCTVYFPSFMPYNLFLEKAEEADVETKLSNLNHFYSWCASRILTMDRKYAGEILNTLGFKHARTDRDRTEIALSYHCLSITDVYWVREAQERITFAQINLYQHTQSNAFLDVALKGKRLSVLDEAGLKWEDSAADISTSGVAPKAWVCDGKRSWLYKGGEEHEVRAELLASKIARCFDVSQVIYEPKEVDGETVSASERITSLEKSIVTAEFVNVYAANHGTTLEAIAKAKDPYGLHMMNIIDYLVGNTDRHMGNWGFLVDNRTNKLGKLHPLMDFNKAFTGYGTIQGAQCQTLRGNMTQMDAAILGVRAVGLNQVLEVSKDWFEDTEDLSMFEQRLRLLKDMDKERSLEKGGNCKF